MNHNDAIQIAPSANDKPNDLREHAEHLLRTRLGCIQFKKKIYTTKLLTNNRPNFVIKSFFSHSIDMTKNTHSGYN